MPIMEEELRKAEMGQTEEDLQQEELEVQQAMDSEALVADAYGAGLDHDTLLKYDVMAHHVAHSIKSQKLAQAEHTVALKWDPLHWEYAGQVTAMRGLEALKSQVIAPILTEKTTAARHELEQRATDLLAAETESQTMNREQFQQLFCGEISKDVTGGEFHPVAVEVYQRLIDPVAKDPVVAEEQPVQEEQKDQAEEQIQEDEQEKQSA